MTQYYYNGPGVYLAEEGTEIRDLKLKKSLGTASKLLKEITKDGKKIYVALRHQQ